MYDDGVANKYECKLCVIITTCYVQPHMREKGHLKRNLLVQEKIEENIEEELKTNNWEKARPRFNERLS